MGREILLKQFTLKTERNAKNQRSVSFLLSIPKDVSRIHIVLKFSSKNKTQLPTALFSPSNELRGIGIHESTIGNVSQELWTAVDSAGKGSIPGAIPEGEWKILVYGRHISEEIHGEISCLVEQNSTSEKSFSSSVSHRRDVVDKRESWYCGELHMHSTESTGRADVKTVARVAAESGLDFIAITDHFTISHWNKFNEVPKNQKPLLIHSCELSGERGHANLHGISKWISPFIDLEGETARILDLKEYDMNVVADLVHENGGLFCINHPLSAMVSWRYHNFHFEKADLIEVISLPDGPNSFLYPVLWDRLLCDGHHIIGVGSSDSHDPLSDGPWKLGKIRNYVWAEELSEPAIIKALKKGQVSVSYGKTRMDVSMREKDWSLDGKNPVAQMGETLIYRLGETDLNCRVKLKNHPRGNLYIIVDGLVYDIKLVLKADFLEKWYVVEFTIKVPLNSKSYLRAEFHEEIVKPYYDGMAYRDATSLRALSNPIWFAASDECC